MSFNFIDILKQVLSMSRLGGAGAVAQLVADVPLSAVEVINIENIKFGNASTLIFTSCSSFVLFGWV